MRHGPLKERIQGCNTVNLSCLKTLSGITVTSAPVSILKSKLMPLSKSGTVHELFGAVVSVSIAPKNSLTSSITELDWTILMDADVRHTVE